MTPSPGVKMRNASAQWQRRFSTCRWVDKRKLFWKPFLKGFRKGFGKRFRKPFQTDKRSLWGMINAKLFWSWGSETLFESRKFVLSETGFRNRFPETGYKKQDKRKAVLKGLYNSLTHVLPVHLYTSHTRRILTPSPQVKQLCRNKCQFTTWRWVDKRKLFWKPFVKGFRKGFG